VIRHITLVFAASLISTQH